MAVMQQPVKDRGGDDGVALPIWATAAASGLYAGMNVGAVLMSDGYEPYAAVAD